MAFEPTMKQREYLYKVVLAAIPVLILLGVVIPGDIQLYFTLAAAVLGVPAVEIARRNVSDNTDQPQR